MRSELRRGTLSTLLFLFSWTGIANTQELRVVPPDQAHWIHEEISGDAAYEHIRYMTQFHRPTGGAAGLWTVAEYYERKAREYGLNEVRLIKQRAANPPWNAESGELWIEGSRPLRVASTIQTPLHLADNSAAANLTAELIDIGAGVNATDYGVQDVRGKIVLSYGPLAMVYRNAVIERGAAGIVWYPSPYDGHNVSYPDQIRWSRLPAAQVRDSGKGFAFILSLQQGLELRERVAADGVLVRADVRASFDSPEGAEPWQVMVEAKIPGTEPELEQDVILTGHLQEEKFSANDDGSGTASILEIARALNHLIDTGRIPRPRRTLRFWWVTEISSQRQYFADNPTAHERIWVNINNDMVGANQAQDLMRVQNITRLPATRFHFLNDVAEAVIEYMVATNNAELAQSQAGSGDPYTRPHLSHLGTRHRYNAKMIFNHNNTDHMPFNEAPIGVPGITFTNWPDAYIHTSDDDLWNIDRTQLGRNAVSTALIAYAMANSGAGNTTPIIAEAMGRGARRIAENLQLGLSWLATEEEKSVAYHIGSEQLDYALEREERAIRSLGEISPEVARLVPGLLTTLNERGRLARAELEEAFRAFSGDSSPASKASPSEAEIRLETLRPGLSAGPIEFLDRRGQVGGVAGLHGIMAFEVLNAVDGRRSGLDIYRYVAAEAREAGAHYYGTVTPEAVLQYLERVAEVGLITLR